VNLATAKKVVLKKTPTATKKLDNVIAMTTSKEFIAKNAALETIIIHTANHVCVMKMVLTTIPYVMS